MSIDSQDIIDLTNSIDAKDIKIDFAQKKIYIVAKKGSINEIKNLMNSNGFRYIGETIKLQYDHNCCDCREPFDFSKPVSDPVKCFVFESSSSSETSYKDDCSTVINFEKYSFQKEGGCFIGIETLELDPNCGCDTTSNCAWRIEESPRWFKVTDLDTSIVYYKLLGGFKQLKVENGEYVYRELQEETYYPITDTKPTNILEIELDECPCLFENRKCSKFIKINVLKNNYEDFDSLVNKYFS